MTSLALDWVGLDWVGLGWFGFVAVTAWRLRPAPTRLDALASVQVGAGHSESTVSPARWKRSLAGLGAMVVYRVPVLRPVPEVWVGASVVAAAAMIPWSTVAAGVAMSAALGGGGFVARRRHRRLERAQAAQLVAFVQVVSVTVGAGATFRTSLAAAATRVGAPLGDLLAATQIQLDRGATVADALGTLAGALGPRQRVVVERLRTAEAAGAPLGPLLRSAAVGLSESHRRDAEVRARRLPVLMLLPLVCCVLPAFVVLAIVPMVVSGSSSLFPL